MDRLKSTIFLVSILFSSALAAAPKADEGMRTVDVCYEPIYTISEVSSTIKSFPTTCVPLGRFTQGEERYRKLMVALGDMKSGFKRAELARGNPNAFAFDDVRVRILGSGITIFIDRSGEGIFNDKKFILTEIELLKVERVLGAIFDCMEHNEEDKLKRQQKPSP
ncbi:hypothetical protein [Massilia genomosp. 1]|uniref:Uncharacterized protein n=1 Tax=Massilia genomosp. 1 TaxID=2609280 RepID=A0ABX0MN51_9BURK|nr:hypothetical protein [Massilia genomosp. 1]NHZ63776.1 hypothetical protein [Massilia genomosp. 1]